MKKYIKKLLLFFSEILFPLTFLATLWLKMVRIVGFGKLSDWIFMKLGILPVPDHYYEPLVNPKKHLEKSLREDRNLPGINMNIEGQLVLLSKFDFKDEILQIPLEKEKELEFYFNNNSYESGDAEYLYNMIRHFKPMNFIEIGCGYSTLMAQKAISQNKQLDNSYKCNHISIEPYEMPWLKELNVNLIRKKVEDIDVTIFETLQENDVLFIDSSHIIRPQGDVLFEFLEILPKLKKGVLVHVHDIFTPKDYPSNWVLKEHRLWNEQYLLEAFLTCNSDFEILGAVNHLHHQYSKELHEKCPILANQKKREPGSFWMIKS